MAKQDEEITAADVIAKGQQAAADTLADELHRTTRENIEQTERLDKEAAERSDKRFEVQAELALRSVRAREALAAAMTRIAIVLEK